MHFPDVTFATFFQKTYLARALLLMTLSFLDLEIDNELTPKPILDQISSVF